MPSRSPIKKKWNLLISKLDVPIKKIREVEKLLWLYMFEIQLTFIPMHLLIKHTVECLSDFNIQYYPRQN